MRVELKVKPVTRYIVTKFVSENDSKSDEYTKGSGSVSTIGEYDNADVAYEVGYAIARQEQERLGYMPGDERIQFPERPTKNPFELTAAGVLKMEVARVGSITAGNLRKKGW